MSKNFCSIKGEIYDKIFRQLFSHKKEDDQNEEGS
ncbi:hypothetical protein PB1_08547 [Bacillus methanolicus PB1]|uniref:Uncharacterized protein n=1 Tax=Bacillus methanolicus PB1 TaxID=997296 RepID=I3E1M4_BACMT|nr:hypothetical protein PB1_08547 [Bacillus methanolicus PB1]